MIKNIVLDMGNVLLDFNPEFVLNRFCSSDEEKNIIREELFEGPEWLMGDKGDIKDADRFDLQAVCVLCTQRLRAGKSQQDEQNRFLHGLFL